MSAAPSYKNFIAGQWVPARSGELYEDLSPADLGQVVGRFPRSGKDEVEEAVASAREAFAAWRLTPAPRRAEIVFRLGQILIEHKEVFARDMTREMGKVLKETRGDVQEAIDTAFYAAGEGRRLFGHTVPSELPDKFAMSVRSPVGVAGLITPWNFPMAIPSWKLLPAIVCGNTVVLKPATDTPLSAVNFIKACEQAGVPAGVVNLVMGPGEQVGEPLLAHPDVRIVSFTGSTAVGRRINQAAAPSFKRVSLEMGGKNPILILEDADLDLALDGVLWGAFGTTGQRCTAASRVILHRDIARPFTERLVARTRRLVVGDGLDPATEVGPLINKAAVDRVHGMVEVARKEGARLLVGGQPLTRDGLGKGAFYEPTVLGDVDRTHRIAREEVFGPVLALLVADGLEQAIHIANDSSYGLSAAIYTRDVNRAFRAVRELESGIVYVNAPTIGAEVQLPFGGTKETGNGHREAGQAVLDLYTEWKSVYVDYSGSLQRAQIDNRQDSRPDRLDSRPEAPTPGGVGATGGQA